MRAENWAILEYSKYIENIDKLSHEYFKFIEKKMKNNHIHNYFEYIKNN